MCVTVHKHDGSTRTSVLTLRFYVVFWGGLPLFTEQIALSLNKFQYNKNVLRELFLPQLML